MDTLGVLSLWMRSQVETTPTIPKDTFEIKAYGSRPRVECVPAGQFSAVDPHCYVVERLDLADNVTDTYQAINTESDEDTIYAHGAYAWLGAEQARARYMAIGFMELTSFRARALHNPEGLA